MSTGQSGVRSRYEDGLWWTMEQLGITESIERKVIAAVAIQFLVTVGIFLSPFVLSGLALYAVTTVLFAGALTALLNTVLIVRSDFTAPIKSLATRADRIAAGDLDVEVTRVDQDDEIGALSDSFADMHAYLETVSDQAEALADQEFDDPVLDEDVPGAFGESLSRMSENLESYTDELEAMTERLEGRSERLESLVSAFGDAAERAQNGDLTATIDRSALDIENAEYEQLVTNYNELVTTIGETVSEVKEFAGAVSTTSDQAEASMSEVDRASDEVATSVQEISDGAATQTENLQEIAEEINTLSATVQQIAASADDAAGTAQEAAARSQSGREAAEDAIGELDQLESRIEATATAVEELAAEIGEIDEIVSFIEEVAEETNMLALNASIEAARAEAGGEGFAVVADEVKNLAEETREYAADISDRIETVQTASEDTVSDVQAMESQVTESVETIETTLHDFEDIVDEVTTVNRTVQEISDATDEQAQTTQELVGMVDDVASISEETTAEAENVAAAAEQQTASISEVTGNVRTLSTQSDDLRELLGGFTVADSRRETTTTL
jgi:methyl-accepting chemotaxis protein